jgi:hypothetical protein
VGVLVIKCMNNRGVTAVADAVEAVGLGDGSGSAENRSGDTAAAMPLAEMGCWCLRPIPV